MRSQRKSTKEKGNSSKFHKAIKPASKSSNDDSASLQIKFQGTVLPIIESDLPKSSSMCQLIHATSMYKLLQDISCVSERIMALNNYNGHDKLDFLLQSLATISKSSIKSFNAFFSRTNVKVPVMGKVGFDDVRMRGLDLKLSELVDIMVYTYELISSFIDFNFGIHKKMQGISQDYKKMEEEVILLREILSKFKPNTLTGPLHVTVKRVLKLHVDSKNAEIQTEIFNSNIKASLLKSDQIQGSMAEQDKSLNFYVNEDLILEIERLKDQNERLVERSNSQSVKLEDFSVEKQKLEIEIQNLYSLNKELEQKVEQNAIQDKENALIKNAQEIKIEALSMQISELMSKNLEFETELQIKKTSIFEKDNEIGGLRNDQKIKAAMTKNLVNQIKDLETKLTLEKDNSRKCINSMELEIENLKLNIKSLDVSLMEGNERNIALEEELFQARLKSDKLQELLDALTETDSLIANLNSPDHSPDHLPDFEMESKERLSRNSLLIFLLSQKSKILRTAMIERIENAKVDDYETDSFIDDPIITREEYGSFSQFTDWHENTLQELETVYIKRLKNQKRSDHEKELIIWGLKREKSILMSEISQIQYQKDENERLLSIASAELNQKSEIIKELSQEISKAQEQIQSKESLLTQVQKSFQESEENLKRELSNMTDSNKEMENTIAMSIKNQNALLSQINTLESEQNNMKNHIEKTIIAIQDLKETNQNLNAVVTEQEILINSYNEPQILNLKDCEISKIQKAIQGNNYQILFLERKNLEYRKAILKTTTDKKIPFIKNETRSLYERTLVYDAAQILKSEYSPPNHVG